MVHILDPLRWHGVRHFKPDQCPDASIRSTIETDGRTVTSVQPTVEIDRHTVQMASTDDAAQTDAETVSLRPARITAPSAAHRSLQGIGASRHIRCVLPSAWSFVRGVGTWKGSGATVWL